jgi:hypothetical protein
MYQRCGAWSLLLLFTAIGCHRGPELAPVSGHITYNGKALDLAEVSFEPTEGRASHALTDKDGHYELRYTRDAMGGLVGPHTVRIKALTELTGPKGNSIVRPQFIPARYNTQSELHCEVESGQQNVFDFDLKSDAKTATAK